MNCPCHSGNAYEDCCKPYHDGAPAPTAETLMRSRYAAYALGLPQYIIDTTHPDNPLFINDHRLWSKQIKEFSEMTSFDGLNIHERHEEDNNATVTFTATMKQNKQDATFTERSHFKKMAGRWLYVEGEIRDARG